MWSLFKAGKYAGRSLPQILFMDPDYFFWAVERKIFQGRLAAQAAELSWKARHIKIPKPDPENWCVEYFFTPENKFSWYQFVDPERAGHVGSSITSRSKHIDMSVVRESCRYDKRGYKRFIKNLKRHLFGNLLHFTVEWAHVLEEQVPYCESASNFDPPSKT